MIVTTAETRRVGRVSPGTRWRLDADRAAVQADDFVGAGDAEFGWAERQANGVKSRATSPRRQPRGFVANVERHRVRCALWRARCSSGRRRKARGRVWRWRWPRWPSRDHAPVVSSAPAANRATGPPDFFPENTAWSIRSEKGRPDDRVCRCRRRRRWQR